jgi:hypothetical protein
VPKISSQIERATALASGSVNSATVEWLPPTPAPVITAAKKNQNEKDDD